MEVQERNALEELLEEIREAIRETVTLQITTIVGDVQQGGAGGPPSVTNSKTMFTQIDLIQGDIVSMIDNAFLDEEFAALREQHQQRETHAHEIVHKNIEILKELSEFIRDLMAESPE